MSTTVDANAAHAGSSSTQPGESNSVEATQPAESNSVEEKAVNEICEFRGEWDDEGVNVYQAYRKEIADWAIEHQTFGGPLFLPSRMTWIKPSFAWMLYRSGYGSKPYQEQILKIKLRHDAMASILNQCSCGHGGGGTNGRIQWDPERDLFHPSEDSRELVPRRITGRRAIQIGVKGALLQIYLEGIISIESVTALAHEVGHAHGRNESMPEDLLVRLPSEREYVPQCTEDVLRSLKFSTRQMVGEANSELT